MCIYTVYTAYLTLHFTKNFCQPDFSPDSLILQYKSGKNPFTHIFNLVFDSHSREVFIISILNVCLKYEPKIKL